MVAMGEASWLAMLAGLGRAGWVVGCLGLLAGMTLAGVVAKSPRPDPAWIRPGLLDPPRTTLGGIFQSRLVS